MTESVHTLQSKLLETPNASSLSQFSFTRTFTHNMIRIVHKRISPDFANVHQFLRTLKTEWVRCFAHWHEHLMKCRLFHYGWISPNFVQFSRSTAANEAGSGQGQLWTDTQKVHFITCLFSLFSYVHVVVLRSVLPPSCLTTKWHCHWILEDHDPVQP